MKKVVVIGKGSFIASHLPYEKSYWRLHPIEDDIRWFLNRFHPDVVINTIGFCGTKNIDEVELDKARASITNTVLPIMLASECEKRSIQLIHMGSGCINYGSSPHFIPYEWSDTGKSNEYKTYRMDTGWKETDFSAPLSYYSKTKYATDLAIGSLPNTCILRLRMPISPMNSPRNLLNKLIKYNRVLEEPNSVTFVSELVRAVEWVIEGGKTGIYNIASPKPLTHSRLLNEFNKYDPTHTYESITAKELEGIVSAPRSNCILDVSKSISEGFTYRDTDELVKETVKEFAGNLLGTKI